MNTEKGRHVRRTRSDRPRVRALRVLLPLLLFAAYSGAIASAQAPKTILISDVDDTIKLTRIVNRRHLPSEIENALSGHGAFVGMSQIYSLLHASGVEIAYVSGAPRFISHLPKDFLEDSRFPSGPIFLRWNPFASTESFKVRTIQTMLQQNRGARVMLIGDNGERDCASYERVKEDPEVGYMVKGIYIHKLYEGPPSMAPLKDQHIFMTAAELALGLHADGLLTTDQLREVLVTVRDGLASKDASTRNHTLPAFAEIQEADVEAAFGQTWPQDDVAEQLLRDIQSRELEQARGGP